MIRQCDDNEFEMIYEIINDAAQAYKGVISMDRWKEPYMSRDELQHEMDEGVIFWGYYEEEGELVGVAGIQHVQDVTLIRHAYVRTAKRNQGIGGKLLSRLRKQTSRPVLIGTWADAVWAIRFYEKHGFRLVPSGEKDRLLKKYWSVPERQIETSVVLADQKWFDALQREANSVYREETLHVGSEAFVESASPRGRYAVVFEDDGATGYYYALDTSREGNPIVDALHIYDVESVVDRETPSTLQIVWSADGLKSALVINDYPHAVFDFEARRGYCRSGFPPPDRGWTQYGHEWDDAALELFK